MITDLKHFIIFLHGFAGAGKGEMRGEILCYIPLSEANDHIPRELYQPLTQEVQGVRRHLASIADLPESTSFMASFRAHGISTTIRDEDISPLARETRVLSQVKVDEGPKGKIYSPGFVTQILIDELEYIFQTDGSFASKANNCIVITNGSSRGIGLDDFRKKCTFDAKKIYNETEHRREKLFEID